MFIEAPELASYPNLRHAFFTRQGGVSEGIYASLNGGLGSSDDPARVAENRRRMAADLGIEPEDRLVSLYQVHSADRGRRRPPVAGRAAEGRRHGDARPGIALGDLARPIAARSCSRTRMRASSGAAHAGWRGRSTASSRPPSTPWRASGRGASGSSPCSARRSASAAYEVGAEFIAQFRRGGRRQRPLLRAERAGRATPCSTCRATSARGLDAAGIGEFANLGLCTYADEEQFFSYRRTTHRGEPDYGRLISAIALTH